MKVGLISDTHGYLPRLPLIDALLHAGDIGVDRDPVRWYRDEFHPWAKDQGVPIFATFGNHDRIGERLQIPDNAPSNLRYVTDELIDVLGVPVWFSPWSLRYGDWAWMATEPTLGKKYAKIPCVTRVIVTHGPPLNFGDRNLQGGRCGSEALRRRMRELPALQLVVCGHIHEARGTYGLMRSDQPLIEVQNVSHVNEWYEPIHPITVIDWPPVQP